LTGVCIDDEDSTPSLIDYRSIAPKDDLPRIITDTKNYENLHAIRGKKPAFSTMGDPCFLRLLELDVSFTGCSTYRAFARWFRADMRVTAYWAYPYVAF